VEAPEEAEVVAAVIVAVHAADHEVGLEEALVVEVSTNHKDLGRLTLITQRTTTMALKNETKSSETKKGQSLPNKRAIRPIGKKVEVVSEAEVQTEAVVAQTEEIVAVVAAGIRIVRNNRLYLTQRTATSKLLSKTRQKALLPLANKPVDKSKRCLILSKLCESTTISL
jgi:hypothetical protein